ncbi:hypothetical protein BDQ12DRAFT_729140 [Crucibulum laeve]|uniref:Uncharacterized protein n=1 Tax=Crucibulum laeve TaxID=68775 RepID=A0A5C3LSX0_9AGAR|nr:hypothetical protein BDQ12DRAFT_729140 [Crucibulum laeve]
MTKAHYEGVLLELLSPFHSARPRDTDLRLVLSQNFKLGDKTRNHLRRIVSKNQIQVSMQIDIWKTLESNQQGFSADQSQSLELPTVLMVKDGNIYLRDIGSELGNNEQGKSGESRITDEEGSRDMKSDPKAKAEQNGISLELGEEEPLRHAVVEIVDGKPQATTVGPKRMENFKQTTAYVETKSSRRSSWMEGLKGVQRLLCCK